MGGGSAPVGQSRSAPASADAAHVGPPPPALVEDQYDSNLKLTGSWPPSLSIVEKMRAGCAAMVADFPTPPAAGEAADTLSPGSLASKGSGCPSSAALGG